MILADDSFSERASASLLVVVCTVVVQIYAVVQIVRRRRSIQGLRRWMARRRGGRGLFRAITRDEIGPYYQPIVAASDGSLRGFESLARWQHPRRGVLAAGVFLHHIERQGQMAALDRRMLVAVARDLPELMSRLDSPDDAFVTVNLSPHRLAQPGYAGEILDLLSSEGLDPAGLMIEMTEASSVADWGSFLDNIQRFRSAGVGLAIDDFGAGHANLTLLCQLDVDLVKLDREIVELAMTARGSAVVWGAIATARATGAVVVAEGVEDRAWMPHLAMVGVQCAQGYGIGYPVPLSELPIPQRAVSSR